jgi:hypothetical protein
MGLRRFWHLATIVCAALMLSGCELIILAVLASAAPPREPEPKTIEIAMAEDGRDAFLAYPIDRQFEMYRWARRYMRMCGEFMCYKYKDSLERYFAGHGEKAVPFLTDKLKSTSDKYTQEDVLNIFAQMALLKTYNAAGDASLMTLMKAKTDSMRAGPAHDAAVRDLSVIEANPPA